MQERLREGTRHRGPSPGGGGSGEGIDPAQEEEEEEEAAAAREEEEEMAAGAVAAATITTTGRPPEDGARGGLTPELGEPWPRPPESPPFPSRGWVAPSRPHGPLPFPVGLPSHRR